MEKGKPSLMLAVMDGLKKKGKMDDEDKMEDGEENDSYRAHLEDISKELIAAIQDKDHMAVADLLEEAFECLDSQPHVEGPHMDDEEPKSKGSRY